MNYCARRNGKSLISLVEDLDRFNKWYTSIAGKGCKNHKLYIDKKLYNQFKNVLDESNVSYEIIPVSFLPKFMTTIFTEELTKEQIQEYKENKKREKEGIPPKYETNFCIEYHHYF